jgi:hypothetical protein
MVWRTTLIFAVAALVGTGAAAAKPKKKKKGHAVQLRSFDLARRLVFVEVDGFKKNPPSNHFTMTDDRGRHFVAQGIRCQPPAPTGTRACELDIPVGYERHPMVSLELHLGGLHAKTVAVPPADIKTAWAAAVEAAQTSPPTDSVREGGAARDPGTLDTPKPQTDAVK